MCRNGAATAWGIPRAKGDAILSHVIGQLLAAVIVSFHFVQWRPDLKQEAACLLGDAVPAPLPPAGKSTHSQQRTCAR